MALREAYQLFGRREDLTSNQDSLFSPSQLRLSESGQALIFRRENQACARWGVRLDQPGHPDPPVVWQGRAAVASLEQNFTRLAIPDYPMWTQWPDGLPVRWFAGSDVVLREDAATWVWGRARTAGALIPVREAMPGDWSHADESS